MDPVEPNRSPRRAARWNRTRDGVVSGLLLLVILFFVQTASVPVKPQAAAPERAREPRQRDAVSGSTPEASTDTEAACLAALRHASVAYRPVPKAAAGAVAWPVLLTGPVQGVRVHGTGQPEAATNYLDCRLARALLEWSPALRAKGVVGIEHYSMYRPEAVVGGSKRPSGHATGRAIDVAKFEMRDGRTLSVLHDWMNRRRGSAPCQAWSDAESGKLMRELVCDAAARGPFNIIVTPHHDEAHGNHVHLELGAPGASTWIR